MRDIRFDHGICCTPHISLVSTPIIGLITRQVLASIAATDLAVAIYYTSVVSVQSSAAESTKANTIIILHLLSRIFMVRRTSVGDVVMNITPHLTARVLGYLPCHNIGTTYHVCINLLPAWFDVLAVHIRYQPLVHRGVSVLFRVRRAADVLVGRQRDPSA